MKTMRFTLFAVALVIAAPLAAAEPTPPPPSPQAIGKLHDYAACLATKRPKIVRETLAMDFREDDYRTAMRALAGGDNGCIPQGRLRFANVLVAGGMAEQVLKSDFGGRAAHEFLPADWTARPIASRSPSEYAALCVVQGQPDLVQGLLATKPSSDAEKAAFTPLLDVLPPCMQPKTQMALNRPFYRAILALALYRASRHFAAPASGVGG